MRRLIFPTTSVCVWLTIAPPTPYLQANTVGRGLAAILATHPAPPDPPAATPGAPCVSTFIVGSGPQVCAMVGYQASGVAYSMTSREAATPQR